MNDKTMKIFYVLAALYDAVLGVAFVLFPLSIYAMYQVEPPNHLAYVQFPGLLLIIFGAMFFQVAKNPVKNRGLIPYGIALKASYCGMVFYYMATTGVPAMYVPFAWADLAFLVLFVLTYRSLGARA
jgi:hypothetical protein